MSNYSDVLNKAVRWNEAYETLIDNLSFEETNRNLISGAMFHLSMEHHKGLLILTDGEFYGSSLALLRPQFESLVRGIFYLHCADDKQIESFIKGKVPPFMSVMLEKITLLEEHKNRELLDIKEKHGEKLNDFTHGGLIQVKGRISRKTISSTNFNIEYLSEIVNASVAISYVNCIQLTSLSNNIELANKLRNLFMSIYS